MNKLPQVRNDGIVVQELNDEVLIYFFDTNKAVCLNSTSAIVFNNCNGKTTFDDLKSKYKLTDDLIHFTLDKLNENNLLKEYQAINHFAGLSRRDVIKRIGLGAMVALPVISSVLAPTAVHASSQGQALNSTCTANSQCQSTVCTPTRGAEGVGTTGNQRCCIDTSSVEPGLTAGQTINGVCTVYNGDCCDGVATFQQDPAQAAGRGECIC